ncbi:MAG: hypothetical protein IPN01_23910, partial [Deltaproteobacteria bacterium]|nr:hypothetical protein [Deltaproteobacteria bacterium]
MSFTPPEFHLEHLLRRCFSVAELRSLLTYLPDQGDLKDHLPVLEGITPAAYARQAVRALVPRSLVNRLLFNEIAAQRSALSAEIWAVASNVGVAPLAGTLSPLPEEYSQYADAHAELRTFVGRVEQLEQLREVLLPRSGPVRAAVVCNLRGMAGVGKTFLVERFFMEHLEHFPGGHLKITLGIHDAPIGDGLLRDLAERLSVQLTGEGRLEDRVRAAALAFRALLHLDNVDSQAQARGAAELVARLPGVFLVVTGRFVFDERVTGWRLVPVDPFNEADALAQLRLELTDDNNARIGDDDRRALVTALHGLPLAIRLAASYLNAGYRVEDFLSELKSAGLGLPHLTANTSAHLDRTQWALIATFDISLTALRAMLGAEAEEGMRGVAALGVAPLAGIGRDLLNTIVGDEPVRVIRWVSRAVKLSIVRFEAVRERWRVHKLLSERLRLLDPEETPRALGRLDGWMMGRLPTEPEETRGKRWGSCRRSTMAWGSGWRGSTGSAPWWGPAWGSTTPLQAAPTPPGSAPSPGGSAPRRTPRRGQPSSGAKATSRGRRGSWTSRFRPPRPKGRTAPPKAGTGRWPSPPGSAPTCSRRADSSTRPSASAGRRSSPSTSASETCETRPSPWARSPTCWRRADSSTRPSASAGRRCSPFSSASETCAPRLSP